MVLLLARNGKVVDWQTYGRRDVEQRLPMEKDPWHFSTLTDQALAAQ